MTLIISMLTSSGIVLTADSRQTYQNKVGMVRIGSDSAMKVLELTDKCGVGISGRAFLNEKGQPPKDAGYFIEKFRKDSKLDKLSVKEIGEMLAKHLWENFIKHDVEALKIRIESELQKSGAIDLVFVPKDDHSVNYNFKDKDGVDQSNRLWVDSIHMIVAGIDGDGVGRSYSISVPKGITLDRDTLRCGAMWVGQGDVLSRIILGYAPETREIPFIKDALGKDPDGTNKELHKLEYIINWGTLTIQDAIDFCVLMTRTTENIQRFSDGTRFKPGGVTGVGGEIDIATIMPESGFSWLAKKGLRAEPN